MYEYEWSFQSPSHVSATVEIFRIRRTVGILLGVHCTAAEFKSIEFRVCYLPKVILISTVGGKRKTR